MARETLTVWGGLEPVECASCGAPISAGQPVISDEDGHHYCATPDGEAPAHPKIEEYRAQRRRNAVKESVALFDRLSTEIYYGFNLRIILAEATSTERQVLDGLLRRAEHARRPKPLRTAEP